jgi:lysophospholipid acyltransferase (LPLAT)-like uncharacterized protein
MQLRSAKKKTENAIFRTEALKHKKEIAQGIKVLAGSAANGDRAALADLYRYTGEERKNIDITSDGEKVNFIVPQEAVDILTEIENGGTDE